LLFHANCAKLLTSLYFSVTLCTVGHMIMKDHVFIKYYDAIFRLRASEKSVKNPSTLRTAIFKIFRYKPLAQAVLQIQGIRLARVEQS
jgi:hypothetical protein